MTYQPEYKNNGVDHIANPMSSHQRFRQTQLASIPSLPTSVEEGEGFSRKSAPQLGDKIDQKILVLCPTAGDPNTEAISSILAHVGIPFDVVVADRVRLSRAHLCQGNHAQ
jgi:hypothetical protein